jgi:hypothetical protein
MRTTRRAHFILTDLIAVSGKEYNLCSQYAIFSGLHLTFSHTFHQYNLQPFSLLNFQWFSSWRCTKFVLCLHSLSTKNVTSGSVSFSSFKHKDNFTFYRMLHALTSALYGASLLKAKVCACFYFCYRLTTLTSHTFVADVAVTSRSTCCP